MSTLDGAIIVDSYLPRQGVIVATEVRNGLPVVTVSWRLGQVTTLATCDVTGGRYQVVLAPDAHEPDAQTGEPETSGSCAVDYTETEGDD